jgi:hypothetical protein
MSLRRITAACLSVTFALFLAEAWSVVSSRPAHGASGDPRPSNAVTVGYFPDQTAKAFRSVIGVADSTNIATITSTSPAGYDGTASMADFVINGKPNIDLEAVFTNASQTCIVTPLWEYEDTTGLRNTRWGLPVTLTASALAGPSVVGNLVTGGTGFATAPGYVFDTGGATHVRFVVTTAAVTGTVSLYPISF